MTRFKKYPDLAFLTAVVHLFLSCLKDSQCWGSPVHLARDQTLFLLFKRVLRNPWHDPIFNPRLFIWRVLVYKVIQCSDKGVQSDLNVVTRPMLLQTQFFFFILQKPLCLKLSKVTIGDHLRRSLFLPVHPLRRQWAGDC